MVPRRASELSGVIFPYSNSHSRSWRGIPVQAQIRCLDRTLRVVSRVAQPELGNSVGDRGLPGYTVLIDKFGEQECGERLGVRGHHEQGIAIGLRGSTELLDPEAIGKDDFAVLYQAKRDTGDTRPFVPAR